MMLFVDTLNKER